MDLRIFVAGFLGIVCCSQEPPFSPGQWVENRFLATSKQSGRNKPVLFDFKGHHEELPPLSKEAGPTDSGNLQALLRSGNPGGTFYRGEHFYCHFFKVEGRENELLSSNLLRLEKGAWIQVGAFKHPRQRGRVRFFPLENGKFLGISKDLIQISKDKRADSLFCLFKLKEPGEFEYENSLGTLEKGLLNADRSDLFLEALTAQSDDRLLFVLPRLGLFWLFSLENGQIKKSGSVYELKEEHFSRRDYPSVVIGIQPQKDGSFILATRVPEVLTLGLSSLSETRNLEKAAGSADSAGTDQIVKLWMNRHSESIRRFPFVKWWEMSSTGTLRRLDPPPFGVKEMLNNYDELKQFAFAPLPNGDLMTVEPDFRALEKVGAKPTLKK